MAQLGTIKINLWERMKLVPKIIKMIVTIWSANRIPIFFLRAWWIAIKIIVLWLKMSIKLELTIN